MLQRLRLSNFKAFERFELTFRGDTLLVGPNNAGKSTLIAALRAVANMIRIAGRLRPSSTLQVGNSNVVGHPFANEQVDLVGENLRHEFHQVETKLDAFFTDDAELHAVWPVDEDDGFFYTRHGSVNLREPRAVRRAFPSIGFVPVLSPIDHVEGVLSDEHVRRNYSSRLASRHLRNQLRLLKSDVSETHIDRFEEFKAFAAEWISELSIEDLRVQVGAAGTGIDLFYLEPNSRIPKEVFWAGDGMQIWLQILLHIFRLRNSRVLVLDEPDVFLHSDLQRRLVDLLESIPGQVITATHSPEVLAEAAEDAVIWISRERRRGVRSPEPGVLYELSDTLGTQFNLRLARTLRARCVLFVEGEDLKILRHIARTLGATRVVREQGIAVIPLIGFDRWEQVEPFQWLIDDVLGNAVSTHVVLDRDYRDDEVVATIEDRLRNAGIHPHVWSRHELENYLLNPGALARLSGADEEWIRSELNSVAATFEVDVYAGIQADRTRRLRPQGVADKTIAREAKQYADHVWANASGRLRIAPGKEMLSRMNEHLQQAGFSAVTARNLARNLRADEIPDELKAVVSDVDQAAGSSV